MARDTGRMVSLLAGLLTVSALHLFFIWTWGRLFIVAPWPGYEDSARLGLIEPWFVNSPRSLWLTRTVLFFLALGFALGGRRGRWPRALLLWAGAALAVIVTYATTRMPAMPAGGLGYVLYPFRVLLPILIGTAIGELAGRTLFARRTARRPNGDTDQ